MSTEKTIYYNKKHLEEAIRQLAGQQIRTRDKKPLQPVKPILENAKNILTRTYRELARSARQNMKLSSAGEWLVDNFYIIQEQLVQLNEDLPPTYYNNLPKLKEGEFKGYPCVYELVQQLALASDNIIDQDNSTTIIQSYQEIEPLEIGELWAFPILIRLVLIERLAEKSEQLYRRRKIYDRVDEILADISKSAIEEPGFIIRRLSDITSSDNPEEQFLTILAHRFQAAGLLTDTERNWFDYKFRYWNSSLEDQLRIEAQRTSRLHLSIQNAISSLREVSETDWSEFVESCSVVERLLKHDPPGYYSQMDFQTRDRYRKVVEKLSANSMHSEQDVAQQLLQLAEKGAHKYGEEHKQGHIGYYLIDEGYEKLIKAVKYRMPLDEKIQRWIGKHPLAFFTCIGLHVLLLLGIVGFVTGLHQAPGWLKVLSFAVAFFPALDLSVVSINRFFSLWLPPRVLPKLQWKHNIPKQYRTVVVVPTLFSSPQDVRDQFEMLEIRSLANPDHELQFIMLSDFTDADVEHTPSDKAILNTARQQVIQLNRRYSSSFGDKFFLFHRKRLWNPAQNKWMGWERKRGKLEELNQLLRSVKKENSFITKSDDFLHSIERTPVTYVITLDADTKLPPGSAVDLIRTAAHPLNRPEVNEKGSFVEKGYGIIQPRISIPPKSAGKSWFAQIFSGNVGLDPYTTAISDIYQDLFGEGIFTGKGIYDVKAFESVLGERFSENTILSHDLLESTYLRCGLASDIELFDDYPTTYISYSKRNHRWIRGDWQILSWLKLQVPGKEKGRETNPINIISKWKIFDNLRRSLTPFSLLVFLLAGWTVLPGSPLIWTMAVLGITAYPIYSSFSTEIFNRPPRVQWKLYLGKIRSDIKINTIRAAITFIVMPHQAYTSMDAILRTLWRRYVSRVNLLEWTSSSQTETQTSNDLFIYWEKMWINIAWGILCIALSWIANPQVLILAIPFGITWIVAPFVAYLLSSRKSVIEKKELQEEDIRELRRYARRTWHYFERYVNERNSWLPPDNFQEDPFIGEVGRTSPTNIGLGLSATYTAYEFGYLTAGELLKRIEKTIESMKMLDRYSGHFYNWYSTQLGEVLNPRYISMVDSGNLAAGLLFLHQALKKMGEMPWPNNQFWQGLSDTVGVLREISNQFKGQNSEIEEWTRQVDKALGRFEDQIPVGITSDPNVWKQKLDSIEKTARELSATNLNPIRNYLSDVEVDELTDWFQRPLWQIRMQIHEIEQVLEVSDGSEIRTIFDLYDLEPFSGWKGCIDELIQACETLVQEMDFKTLYDQKRDLFSIGYNVDHASLDNSTYDLLASEARLGSFIAIAKGDVPPKHWFKLSRRLTSINRNEILLSWGGTMFEYLMPLLFLEQLEDTLLSKTYENVVTWQKKYGESLKRPWGFSESGYSVVNLEMQYQYRAFGAPGLGLKRGLAEDYVVAPYASLLALMIQPRDALENLRQLKKEGAYGLNGFYEAVHYTPNSSNIKSEKNIVKMYMAHHQGMTMLTLANVLNNDLVQQIFHSNPLIKACELLLQERVPRGVPIKEPRPIDVELEPGEDKVDDSLVDHEGMEALNDSPSRTHVLSNGTYSTVITHTGTGYSTCNEMALTRWRAERVKDALGFFVYVRDIESNEFWSVGYRPVNKKADRYDTWFHPGGVQIARVDEWIETFTEVCVSPEDNIEFRKITLTNYSDRRRRLDLTSYAEVVLNRQEADAAHPAFSNLFVQTDYIREHHALIVQRRPRQESEEPVWLVHTIASEDFGKILHPLQYETDRGSFIGRCRSLDNPAAMDSNSSLSGSIGNVPDPIVSMRQIVELGPGEKKSITFGLGTVKSRKEAVSMADRYDNPYVTDRIFELASIYGRVELEHIDISGKQANYFQKLAGALLYDNEQLRASEEVLMRNRQKQSGLWPYGISGDVPILLYRISDINHIRYVEQLLKAHMMWRLKALHVDLVIVYDHPPSYIIELRDAINSRIQSSSEQHLLNKRGGVFVLHGDEVMENDLILLQTVAAVTLEGKLPKINFGGSESFNNGEKKPASFTPVKLSTLNPDHQDSREDLVFFNGYGGYSKNGDEYVIHLSIDEKGDKLVFPPAPWINVIANPHFGFITSERGSDYTWSLNSRENRLTPWSNDSIIDPAGEALYIRDENSQLFWSPTPGPTPGSSHYEVRHGFGYTRYKCETMKLRQEVTKWVSKVDPVKLIRLRLTNSDQSQQTLSVYHYLEWVLGVFRERSARFVITEFDSERNTIFARNYYNNEFSERVAFVSQYSDTQPLQESFTADRTHFIGKNNGVTNPRSLCCDEELSGRFGAGFDPCAASQRTFHLESGETTDIYFMIGEADSAESAKKIVQKYQSASAVESSFEEARDFWKQKLNRIQITTPNPELDIIFNGWLQYQNIACRMWARSGFYQSGGAFGFRDQLQDATAALYADPDLARRQILLHAAHQFPEGDVLHWWHPPTGRGIRSRISDDLLWLPYVTAFYVDMTDNRDILDEKVSFIASRRLEEGEHEVYLTPEITNQKETLFEHCCRAIDRSLTQGVHGLPLIGAGDWNDGMNRVGEEGRGESVWLAFFLYDVLSKFIPLCEENEDDERVEKYSSYKKQLKKHLNNEGWDGEWYRRAFYDDGTPLGSAENDECKIDAIAQAWAVISGAAPDDKVQKALKSAQKHLVSESDGIIRLLTPPFDKTEKNPGYIKGYIPGVRENGGQYTHAGLWLTKAFAEAGFQDYAVSLITMLNPINHALSKETADRYKVEPFAVAADIYGEPPLIGRGGWTWYTGSAGWMYRVILESILGVKIVKGNILKINSRLIASWKEYSIEIKRENNTIYRIKVLNNTTTDKEYLNVQLDGKVLSPSDRMVTFKMEADGKVHNAVLEFKSEPNE